MSNRSAFALLVALALAAGCGGAQVCEEPAPPPPCPELEPAPPTDHLGRMRASLASAGLDPDAIACDTRVVWGAGLHDDAEALAAELDALYEPHLRRGIGEDDRQAARRRATSLAMGWMIRALIVHGDTNNFGGLVLPGLSWRDRRGETGQLVVFHSATTPEPAGAGSCLRSLIGAGRVRHVVNLYSGEVPLAGEIEAERAVATELRASYADAGSAALGYGDWRRVAADPEAAPAARAEAMRAVARLVREQVLRPEGAPPQGNVYVHCAGGMHRSMIVSGVLRRCVVGEPLERIREAMQHHGAYETDERPGGYEEPLLRFVGDFDCGLLEDERPAGATPESAPGTP